jgi:hypothetical protein
MGKARSSTTGLVSAVLLGTIWRHLASLDCVRPQNHGNIRAINVWSHKKLVVITAILVFTSTFFTIYVINAHIIAANFIYQDPNGEIWWRTAPSGSLFPWPSESGMLQVLSNLSEVDLFIYQYLIKSWVLVGLAILVWICNCVYFYKAVWVDLRKSSKSKNSSHI